MRIPLISDWIESNRERKKADENAEKEKKLREALRAKASTETRAKRELTDSLFGEVVATTKDIESDVLNPVFRDGRKITAAELAEEAYEAMKAKEAEEAGAA